MPTYSNRRIFLNKLYHIFTFIQEKDGSIYCHWPAFEKTKFIICKENENGLIAIEASTPGEGKFTIHGSGMTGFKQHQTRYDEVIIFHGNHLINADKTHHGIRHLFTAQMPEPSNIPASSPYLNRESDYSILASEVCPFILIFFAFPKRSFELECDIKFDLNDIMWSETSHEPTNYLGANIIELKTHIIVWIAYRTSNMSWPKNPYIFYDNGYKIPLILGRGNKEYIAQLRKPNYSLSDDKIRIEI